MPAKTKATATPSLKLLVGQPAIEAALKSIHTRGATLQTDIHVAACSVLQHIGKHSDVRMAGALLAAMPECTRKTAMMIWLAKFGPVEFENDKAQFVKDKPTKLGEAMALPFWKLTPDNPYKAIDEQVFISSMVKKLQHDTKQTKVDHSAMIAALQAISVSATAH